MVVGMGISISISISISRGSVILFDTPISLGCEYIVMHTDIQYVSIYIEIMYCISLGWFVEWCPGPESNRHGVATEGF